METLAALLENEVMRNFSDSYVSVIFYYFPLASKDFLIRHSYKPECTCVGTAPKADVAHSPKELMEKRESPHSMW